MLVQMPDGASSDAAKPITQAADAFEAGLRRDLATAPVISYDAPVGGWSKRALDIALTALASPVWGGALLWAVLAAKLDCPGTVLHKVERIGHGGRAFEMFQLRLQRPSAVVEPLHRREAPPQADANEAMSFRPRVFELVPLLINVLRGDMALVGPAPLPREALDARKAAQRFYLSARPGVFGIAAIGQASDDPSTHAKTYARAWSHGLDAGLLWRGLRALAGGPEAQAAGASAGQASQRQRAAG